MVKTGKAHLGVISAFDHALERTKKLSQKPQIGSELIPQFELHQDVFPDLDMISRERDIYGKLDNTRLRKSELSRSSMVLLEKHWETEESRQIAQDLHYLISKERDSAKLELRASKQELKQHLQTYLQYAVIVRLPKGTAQDAKLNQMCWTSNNLKQVQNMIRITSLVAMLERIANDKGNRRKRTSSKDLGVTNMSQDKTIAIVRSSLTGTILCSSQDKVTGMLEFNLYEDVNRMIMSQKVSSDANFSKYGTEEVNNLCHTGRFEKISLCRASGFGTAPIWFQQSMPNGPPDEEYSSLNNER